MIGQLMTLRIWFIGSQWNCDDQSHNRNEPFLGERLSKQYNCTKRSIYFLWIEAAHTNDEGQMFSRYRVDLYNWLQIRQMKLLYTNHSPEPLLPAEMRYSIAITENMVYAPTNMHEQVNRLKCREQRDYWNTSTVSIRQKDLFFQPGLSSAAMYRDAWNTLWADSSAHNLSPMHAYIFYYWPLKPNLCRL